MTIVISKEIEEKLTTKHKVTKKKYMKALQTLTVTC